MDTQKMHELAEKLLGMPQTIQEGQVALMKLNETILNLSEEISVIESKIKSEIASEVDENNKKVYPNSESRDAAFVERSSDDETLIYKKRYLLQLQGIGNVQRFEIERFQNDQRNIRSVLDFFKSI